MSGPPPGPRWHAEERPKNIWAAWRQLLSYMGRYRWHVMFAIALSVTSALLALVGPGMLRDITDTVADGISSGGPIDTGRVTAIALPLTALYAVSAVLGFGEHYVISSASQKVSNKVRRDLARKIDRIPLNYYDSTSAGDIMSRLTNDADTIARSSGQSIAQMISSAVMMLGAFALMLYTNAALTAVAVVPAACGLALIYALVKQSQKYYLANSRSLGAMQGHVDEVYSGLDVVRAYNGEKAAKRKFTEINQALYRTAHRTRFISGMMPQIMNFVSNLGYALVCVIGAMLKMDGTISYGVIVAFIVYVRQFTSPLTDISESLAQMQSVAASSERVFEFLGIGEMGGEEGAVEKPSPAKGEVEFRDVRFGYLPGREVIHGFSAKVSPGENIAIVGPTGAGKTTLVNLLMRFYDVGSGDILVDGVSIGRMRRRDVHDLFTMVLQDAWIFDGTIRENVVYDAGDIPDEEVVAACEAVGIDPYIRTLKDGYDTVISGNGSLSAGQRQQIAIARAMVRGAPLLILDEATSSVDTRTERHIQAAMAGLSAGRTSFIIAHRLTTVRNADLILVVRDGEIAEQGTHDELLARGGFYSTLYDSQFEDCDRVGGKGESVRGEVEWRMHRPYPGRPI